MNKIMIVFLLFFSSCFSQEYDSIQVEMDSLIIETDTLFVEETKLSIYNDNALLNTFTKLVDIEKNQARKLRIVHIGDSHIQADIVTDYIRQHLQSKFGNAGLGFTFPYKLAGANGTSKHAKFTSNASFNSYKIIKPKEDKPVGISGIALYTDQKKFSIELKVKDQYKFNSIRLITPKNENTFQVATDFRKTKEIKEEKIQVKNSTSHKIKKGEVLSKIAQKYGITVSDLKKANGLKTDKINFGKILQIPNQKTGFEVVKKEVVTKEFEPLQQLQFPYSYDYYAPDLMESIHLIPNKDFSNFALNGVVLENEKPGITYSAIGINGAKTTDYNKYDLFYEQLSALEPDLVIISLGTNESFDKMSGERYMQHLFDMIDKIKTQNYLTEILVTTPPPSQFKRKYKNTFEADYATKIVEKATEKEYAVWDLYKVFGGSKRVNANFRAGLITADKVHYTYEGYKKQGNDFFSAFMQSYESFKSTN